MTTQTQTLTRPARTLPQLRVTPANILRSEWTKFRSLRSMWVTLLVVDLLVVGLGALITGLQAANHTAVGPNAFNPVTNPLSGVMLAQLAVGVLGVLLASGEYATGMIRSTLTAVPRRLPVLWAKVGVLSAVTLIASTVATFTAFLVGQALLSGKGLDVSLTSAGALRSVVGAAAYLVVVAIIGLALGSLLRNTAAAISTLVGLLFVLPPLLSALPASWHDHIAPYLPGDAGQALWAQPSGAHLSPYVGFGLLCAWAISALALAAVALARRDA